MKLAPVVTLDGDPVGAGCPAPLNKIGKMRFTPRPYNPAMAKKAKQPRKTAPEVAWTIYRLTSPPAARVGRVFARTGEEAIERVIEKFKVSENLRTMLVARRES